MSEPTAPVEPDTEADTEASAEPEATTAPGTDWSIIEHPSVLPILEGVSSKIGSQYSSVTTPGDQYQEGSLYLAQNAEEIRGYLNDPLFGERVVWRWLYSKLREGVRTDALHAANNVSLSGDNSSDE